MEVHDAIRRQCWLALTQEPPLEPQLPICNAHHHFWDLRPKRIPYQRYP